jgi:chromosome segregation ATPase
MLADLVQKNQTIIQELQTKVKETESEYEDKLNETQTNFKVQLEYLESENRVLKELQDKKMTSEKDRANFHKTLRNLLLEEIQRIEKEQAEKDHNMAEWRDHLLEEVKKEKEDMMERQQELEETNKEFQNQQSESNQNSSQSSSELQARVDYLTNNKKSLEQKVDELTKQINSLQGSLVFKRQQSTTDETKWESEKDDLYKSLNSVSEILEEKERLHGQQLKSVEDGYKTSIEVLDRRIKMVNDEKRQLDKLLNYEKGDMNATLDECNTQINQLRDTNTYLISLFDNREKQAAMEIERMRDEVGSLQMFFDNREVNYVQETRKYADNVKKLHTLLERAHERMEEGWDPMKSVSEALRKQVDTLQIQLQQKEGESEKLRAEVINAQNSQRKEITTTVTHFKHYLNNLEIEEEETEMKYKNFLNERMENDKITSERELDDLNKINDSLSEINDLRFRIRELEANNKEKEYNEANTKLVKTEAELTHAKQNLVNYIQSLNTLEDKMKNKLEANNVSMDENDEILRLKMENVRLNEENSSLLNSKQFTEEDLNDRIEELNKKLFIKTEECEELQTKYSNLLNSLNGEREEEIKSWLRRQDLIKRTVEELRIQLEKSRDKRTSALAMKDQESKLVSDEVKLLRIEGNKLQKFWDNQFNDWVKEKRTYQDEIESLRNTIDTVEEYYGEVTELRKEENDLLAEQRHILREKEDFYVKLANEKIEIESTTKEMRDREAANKTQDTSKITEMLTKDVND